MTKLIYLILAGSGWVSTIGSIVHPVKSQQAIFQVILWIIFAMCALWFTHEYFKVQDEPEAHAHRISLAAWLAEHYTPVFRHDKVKYWQSTHHPGSPWKTTEEVVREWEEKNCPDK